MIISDFECIPNDPIPLAAFVRFDCGDQPTDHHSIALISAIERGHVHSAFEMDHVEEIAINGEWMRRQGYQRSWGIGRHTLGSQIFDYWRETNGDLFEHYSDGDLFDNTKETGYYLLNAQAHHQWGPDETNNFTGKDRPFDMLKSIITRVLTDDDLVRRQII